MLNGLYPGPTIELDRGDELVVRMENRLPDQDLILHWHGILAPSSMNGHPHLAVPSGEDFDYRYTVNRRAPTCWYHPPLIRLPNRRYTVALSASTSCMTRRPSPTCKACLHA